MWEYKILEERQLKKVVEKKLKRERKQIQQRLLARLRLQVPQTLSLNWQIA